jgi:membrane-associated phospholipid phosphatase
MYAIDLAVFNVLYGLSNHSQWFDWLIIAVASYLPWAVVAVVLYEAYRAWQKNLKGKVWGYALAFASGGIARGIVEIIRFYYHHPRPPLALHITPLFPETTYSFPSGHAVFFFGLAMGVHFVNKKLGRMLLISATLIGVARIIVGVHWPSDILAGAALGVLIAWMIFQIWKRFSRTINLPAVE